MANADGVTLIVSIDTEEDNWDRARSGITVSNIAELPRLDRVFERLGIRATYFTTYHVARDPAAAGILRELRATGRAEIGSHLHPWNTPPLDEPFEPRASMLLNLPEALQLAKLRRLTAELEESLGERPQSFRAGRWGLGASTVRALLSCGYRIDSSVTPYQTWRAMADGPDHIGAPVHAYRLDGRGDPRRPAAGGPLLEIPVSSGYTGWWWGASSHLHRLVARPRTERLARIAAQLRLARPVALSPEIDGVADMIALSRRLVRRGARHLHMFFHSPTLVAGLTPFGPTAAAVNRLYAALARYMEQLTRLVAVSCATVSEAAPRLDPAASPPHALGRT